MKRGWLPDNGRGHICKKLPDLVCAFTDRTHPDAWRCFRSDYPRGSLRRLSYSGIEMEDGARSNIQRRCRACGGWRPCWRHVNWRRRCHRFHRDVLPMEGRQVIARGQRNEERQAYDQQLHAERSHEIPRPVRFMIEKYGLFKHVFIDTEPSRQFPRWAMPTGRPQTLFRQPHF